LAKADQGKTKDKSKAGQCWAKTKAKRSDLAKAKVKSDQDLPRRRACFKNYACSEKPMSVPVTKLFLQYVYIGGWWVRANGWGR